MPKRILKCTIALSLALLMMFSLGCTANRASESPIVILGPMECEYQYLVSQLSDVKEAVCGNATFYEGTLDGHPVVVVNCLIGMVNSASAATLAIERYAPRCVIMQGTAGGHDPILHKNDIVLGEDLIMLMRYESPHRDEGEGIRVEDWSRPGVQMLKGTEIEVESTLHSDGSLLALAESVPYSEGKLVRGTIGTADIWNKEIDMINYCHEVLGSDCEEMEGFAVAQVCEQYGVDSLTIRVISNSELYPEETFDAGSGVICQKYCLDVMKTIFAS